MVHKRWSTTIFWVTLFSVAMAYVESSVVVYLRLHYYPEGFAFPLKLIEPHILLVEVFRELATITMLATLAWMIGSTMLERSAYFLYAFGVWDIFYYVFLKIILNWPSSLFEWDILFLIPLPWFGPVLAPVLVSLAIIGCSILLLQKSAKGYRISFTWLEVSGIALGCFLILGSFLLPYGDVQRTGAPQVFRWELYGVGFVTSVFSFLRGYSAKKG